MKNRTEFKLSNPKLQLLGQLIEDCYLGKTNNTQILTLDENIGDDVPWCPRTFDGFSCWTETPPSSTLVQLCPSFIVGFDRKRYAYKRCLENGTWFMHPLTNRPWTNYTSCVDIEDLAFRSFVNELYVYGYSISVAALAVSLIIFMVYFRTLQCTRIRIHIQLFTSFALNNILWIIWYRTVVREVDVVRENRNWCQVLHIITNYFMVTSYLWMFCEGLHLHISLVVVFVKEKVAMRWFLGVGWGASLLIILVYAVVRFHIPGATERCWMDQSDSFWIIVVPVVISLLASLVFLVNVVRVLLTKLQQPNQRTALATRKAVRAALILIPLFGLHFVLIPLRPLPDSFGEKFYQIFSSIITSLQGLCVAILFCFTNHDVLTAMKAHLARYRRNNDGIAMTGESIHQTYNVSLSVAERQDTMSYKNPRPALL